MSAYSIYPLRSYRSVPLRPLATGALAKPSSLQSLWAVPDTGLRADQLAYVMVIVGVMTYLITFNINTVSRAWTRAYHRKREQIIESMKRSGGTHERSGKNGISPSTSKWEARAERYEKTFHIGRGETEPWEWYLALYLVRRGMDRVREGLVDFPLKVLRERLRRGNSPPASVDESSAEEGIKHVQANIESARNPGGSA